MGFLGFLIFNNLLINILSLEGSKFLSKRYFLCRSLCNKIKLMEPLYFVFFLSAVAQVVLLILYSKNKISVSFFMIALLINMFILSIFTDQRFFKL